MPCGSLFPVMPAVMMAMAVPALGQGSDHAETVFSLPISNKPRGGGVDQVVQDQAQPPNPKRGEETPTNTRPPERYTPAECRRYPHLCQFQGGVDNTTRKVAPGKNGLGTIPAFGSGGQLCHDGTQGVTGLPLCKPQRQEGVTPEQARALKEWKRNNSGRSDQLPDADDPNTEFGYGGPGRRGGSSGRSGDPYYAAPELEKTADFSKFSGSAGGLLTPGGGAERFGDLIKQADAYMASGNYQEAIRRLEEAVKINPSRPEAYLKLAQAYNRMNQFESAQRAAMGALGKTPNHEKAARKDAYEALAWAQLNRLDVWGAIRSARLAMNLDANSAWARMILALAHEQLGDHSQMIKELEGAAAIEPVFLSHLDRARSNQRLFQPGQNNDFLRERLARESMISKKNMPQTFAALMLLGAITMFLMRRFSYKLVPIKSRIEQMIAARMSKGDSATEAKRAEHLADGGVRVDKYELKRIAGKGRFGVVWESEDVSLGRLAAVKKVNAELADKNFPGREVFLGQVRAAAGLGQPDIVETYEVLETPTGLYIASKWISGRTLRQIIEHHKLLSLPAAVSVFVPVCRALDFAHGKGVVHGNLKPSNIIVTEKGDTKLMDFGPVPATDASFFTAPEAAQGITVAASDVYSLGVCLYEALTGERPYGNAPSYVSTHLGYMPATQRVAGLPPELDTLISSALAPNKEERIQTVREFYAFMAALPGVASPGAGQPH